MHFTIKIILTINCIVKKQKDFCKITNKFLYLAEKHGIIILFVKTKLSLC